MQLEKKDSQNLYCYITEDDLHILDIRPDTLAYGSNSYRKLLSAIMTRARDDYGFTANDHPLLVEAVPLDNGELFVQISAIEEAEELDPRFAQFAPAIFDDFDPEDVEVSDEIPSDDVYLTGAPASPLTFPEVPNMSALSKSRPLSAAHVKGTIYCFSTYEALLSALRSLGDAKQFMDLRSSLYYQPGKKKYYLLLGTHQNTPGVRALLAALCEHANAQPLSSTSQAWLAEHCRCIIRTHAIPRLIEAVSQS